MGSDSFHVKNSGKLNTTPQPIIWIIYFSILFCFIKQK